MPAAGEKESPKSGVVGTRGWGHGKSDKGLMAGGGIFDFGFSIADWLQALSLLQISQQVARSCACFALLRGTAWKELYWVIVPKIERPQTNADCA